RRAPRRRRAAPTGPGARVRGAAMMALEFDFDARTERALPAAEARPKGGASKYVWFDLDAAADPAGAAAVLRGLGLDGPDVASALDVRPDRGAAYRSLPSRPPLA